MDGLDDEWRAPSVWKRICECVPAVEQEEIKTVLGCALVDEINDLHTERDALLEIWADLNASAKKPAPRQARQTSDAARELLEQSILFFIQNRKTPFRPQTPRDSSIVEYLTSPRTPRPGSAPLRRPGSARRSTGPSTASWSSESPSPDPPAGVAGHAAVEESRRRGMLNAFDIDRAAARLRQALLDERQSLLDDVAYLQSSITEAALADRCSVDEPPGDSELRALKTTLEREYLENAERATAVDTIGPPGSGRRAHRLAPLGSENVGPSTQVERRAVVPPLPVAASPNVARRLPRAAAGSSAPRLRDAVVRERPVTDEGP